MKNILNLTAITTGGGGIACLRFHKVLSQLNYNSYLATPRKELNFNKIKKIISPKIKNNFFLNFFKKIKNKNTFLKNYITKINKYCFYGLENSNFLSLKGSVPKIIDIIFVHWVDGFVNYDDLYKFYQTYKCKIIFLMYDMYPITGGCHYSYECKNFTSGCKSCPAVPFFLRKKISKNYQNKSFLINNINAEICVFSSQDYKLVKQSNLSFAKVHKLFIPIYFRNLPIRQFKIGKKFNILCSALKFDPRKGSERLMELLDVLDDKLNSEKKIFSFFCFDNYFLRKTYKNIVFKKIKNPKSEYEMLNLYFKSDIFLNLSEADSAPMMITEALLCGIPVISTNVGNASDIIINKNNGYLLQKYAPNDLINCIIEITKGKWKVDSRKISNDIKKKISIKKFKKLINKIA
jgi:glycosyltransferase involved in cell wall biosynthesis